MKNSYRVALILVAVLSLAGCVSASTMMVNQDGKWVRCSASGAGWLGAPMAASNHSRCVDDLQKMGYAPLSSAVWGLKTSDWSSFPVKVAFVETGSAADTAGIKAGDIIRKMDGQPVAKGTEVFRLLSDKKPGDILHAQIEREGSLLETTSVLSERK